MIIQGVENFKKIDKSNLFEYYASSNGYVLRVTKSTFNEKKVAIYMKHGRATVKINRKELTLSRVIAKAFIKPFDERNCVVCANGNNSDCRLCNLQVITYSEHGKRTGNLSREQNIKITFPNGYTKYYNSIRAAAKEINCSYQTIIDYLNNKVKKSVLQGYLIERI